MGRSVAPEVKAAVLADLRGGMTMKEILLRYDVAASVQHAVDGKIEGTGGMTLPIRRPAFQRGVLM